VKNGKLSQHSEAQAQYKHQAQKRETPDQRTGRCVAEQKNSVRAIRHFINIYLT
jgi:hypothetical protein